MKSNRSFGLQSAWAINAADGYDGGLGTPAQPLRTMREFNDRFASNVFRVAMTLQCTGDVVDEPLTLQGVRFAAGASLTVSGTSTDIATGTVVAVTDLGALMPWLLETAGIDWTSIPVGSQLRFSTGHFANIVEIVGADNVIVGMLTAPGTAITSAAPTVSSTITASTRSRAFLPIISGIGQTLGVAQLSIQHLSFDQNTNGPIFHGGVNVQLFACELKNSGVFPVMTPFNMRGCRWSLPSTVSWHAGVGLPTTVGLVVAGSGAALFGHQSGNVNHIHCSLTGARLSVNNAKCVATNVNIRNAANPVLVNSGGELQCIGGTIRGSVGNTGISIDLPRGMLSYLGAVNKPSLTARSHPRVGGVTRNLATEVPYVAMNNLAAFVEEE